MWSVWTDDIVDMQKLNINEQNPQNINRKSLPGSELSIVCFSYLKSSVTIAGDHYIPIFYFKTHNAYGFIHLLFHTEAFLGRNNFLNERLFVIMNKYFPISLSFFLHFLSFFGRGRRWLPGGEVENCISSWIVLPKYFHYSISETYTCSSAAEAIGTGCRRQKQ